MCRVQHDDVERPRSAHRDGLSAYYAAETEGEGEPVFDKSLGLTVEAMPAEVTIQTLWSVI